MHEFDLDLPAVAVITPTWKRDLSIIDRCIRSVKSQSYNGKIIHLICSDGEEEPAVKDLVNSYKDVRTQYHCVVESTNSYGGGVRHWILENFVKDASFISYVCHVDDDNVIFPHYIEAHVNALENAKDCQFSICKIVHLGPLPSHLGNAPQVINGIPPVFQNIDTLQVMVRKEAMVQCGWDHFSGEKGYYNDGYTYDRLGKMFKWIEVPELLAIHI